MREETRIVPERPEIVIDLGPLQDGLFELRTEGLDIDIPVLRLDVRNRDDYHVPARITFAFEADNMVRNVTLWDEALPAWFARVRSGQAKLDEVRLPNHCQITITVIAPDIGCPETYSRDSDSGDKATLARDLTVRVRSLLTANERFEIEAHGFGRICFPAAPKTRFSPVLKNRSSTPISPAETARRSWLQLGEPTDKTLVLLEMTDGTVAGPIAVRATPDTANYRADESTLLNVKQGWKTLSALPVTHLEIDHRSARFVFDALPPPDLAFDLPSKARPFIEP